MTVQGITATPGLTTPAVPTAEALAATVATPTTAGAAGAKKPATSESKTHTVALQFESMLVRQLLEGAHMGGDSKSGYGGMAVDALASGIEGGGGLGMAREIERAIDQHAGATGTRNR